MLFEIYVYMHAPPDTVESLHPNQSFDLRLTLWNDRLSLSACPPRSPRSIAVIQEIV